MRRIRITLQIEVVEEKLSCAICGQTIYRNQRVSRDHWIPRSHGGTNFPENIRIVHKICNCIKTDMMPREFMKQRAELFEYALEHWHLKHSDRKILIGALHRMNSRRK